MIPTAGTRELNRAGLFCCVVIDDAADQRALEHMTYVCYILRNAGNRTYVGIFDISLLAPLMQQHGRRWLATKRAFVRFCIRCRKLTEARLAHGQMPDVIMHKSNRRAF